MYIFYVYMPAARQPRLHLCQRETLFGKCLASGDAVNTRCNPWRVLPLAVVRVYAYLD